MQTAGVAPAVIIQFTLTRYVYRVIRNTLDSIIKLCDTKLPEVRKADF